MNILADTHILIWSLRDDDKLPSAAKEYILSKNNEIYYSMVSSTDFWLHRLSTKIWFF